MLKRFKEKATKVWLIASTFVIINGTKVLAITTPDEDEVNDIASKGLKIFFGALAGFAIVMGGLEFYGAFMAHRENKEQGGFGGAQNEVRNKILAGIMCLLAAGVVYIVLRWTQSLFDIA